MEASQDAQAVLGGEQPRFELELVEPLPAKLMLRNALSCLVVAGLLLGAMALGLPGWVLGSLALLGLALFKLCGGEIKPAEVPRRVVGHLLIFADRLVLKAGGPPHTYPLDVTTRIRLRYHGYRGESLGSRHQATGILNFIQLNDGPEYAFDVPHAGRASTLREELRKWYQRRVQLKEYRRGSRTVLLTPDLSDEQVQQYQREFGIRLYS